MLRHSSRPHRLHRQFDAAQSLFTRNKGIFMPDAAPRIEATLKPSEPAPLRDPHIREPLHRWLLAAHADCPDTHILHELKIPRPSARIDIAVVNGELCGFEIKSDVDSLARLTRQERAFSAVFDRVSMVITPRHLLLTQAAIPNWWGIVVARPCSIGASFTTEREAHPNPNRDTEALLHMLCRRELIGILERNGLAGGLRSKRRAALIGAILHASIPNLQTETLSVFKLRAAAYHSSSSSSRILSGA
jgi:hypothetical protein